MALNFAASTVMFNVVIEFFVNAWQVAALCLLMSIACCILETLLCLVQLLPAGTVFGTLIFLADMGAQETHSVHALHRFCITVTHHIV